MKEVKELFYRGLSYQQAAKSHRSVGRLAVADAFDHVCRQIRTMHHGILLTSYELIGE